MLKITGEQARLIDYKESDEFEVVEAGTRIQTGECECQDIIFKDKEGRHYRLSISRICSYCTDYYDWEGKDSYECPQVEQVEVKSLEWVEIKRSKQV